MVAQLYYLRRLMTFIFPIYFSHERSKNRRILLTEIKKEPLKKSTLFILYSLLKYFEMLLLQTYHDQECSSAFSWLMNRSSFLQHLRIVYRSLRSISTIFYKKTNFTGYITSVVPTLNLPGEEMIIFRWKLERIGCINR